MVRAHNSNLALHCTLQKNFALTVRDPNHPANPLSTMWGVVLDPGKKAIVRIKASHETFLNITMASFGPELSQADGNTLVVAKSSTGETKYCMLKPNTCESLSIDWDFNTNRPLSFYLVGKNQVHLSGNMLTDPDKPIPENDDVESNIEHEKPNGMQTNSATRNYLHTIPDDVMHAIARLCSTHPRERIEPHTAYALHEIAPTAAKDLFKVICGKRPWYPEVSLLGYRKGIFDDAIQLGEYFGKCTSILPTVTHIADLWMTPEIINSVVSHCHQLKVLSIDCIGQVDMDLFQQLLEARGNQILHLKIVLFSVPVTQIFAKYCRNLVELEFDIKHADYRSLPLLLASAGSGLLKLTCEKIPVEMFEIIRETCPSLRHIFMKSLEISSENNHLTDLFTSYGSQLETVLLPECLPAPCIRRVVYQCPNVKLWVDPSSMTDEDIDALGYRIELLDNLFPNEFFTDDDFRKLLFRCSLLKQIELSSEDDFLENREQVNFELRQIFREPFPKFPSLESFSVRGLWLCIGATEVRNLALNTGKLRDIDFNFRFENEDHVDCLETLVQHNPHLESVCILLDITEDTRFGRPLNTKRPQVIGQSEERIISKMLRILANLVHLRAVELMWPSNTARTATLPRIRAVDDTLSETMLRRRNIRVCVFGQEHYPAW